MAVSSRNPGGGHRETGRRRVQLHADHDAIYHSVLYAESCRRRPDVIPDGSVNAAFLGQFAETPRDTIFTTEYSVRTAMEAVYGLCGVDRGVPEVWGSVYDVRELLDSTVKLMDGKSPLEMKLPMPFEMLKKPLLRKIDKTIIGKLLRDHDVLKDWML